MDTRPYISHLYPIAPWSVKSTLLRPKTFCWLLSQTTLIWNKIWVEISKLGPQSIYMIRKFLEMNLSGSAKKWSIITFSLFFLLKPFISTKETHQDLNNPATHFKYRCKSVVYLIWIFSTGSDCTWPPKKVLSQMIFKKLREFVGCQKNCPSEISFVFHLVW